MSTGEDSSGLFDLISKAGKKKREETIKEERPMPTKEDRERYANTREAFLRCKKLHDDLKKNIDEAYAKAHIKPQQVTEFFSNPANFSPRAWRKIQEAKARYRTQFGKFFPKGALEAKKPEDQPKKKQKRSKKGYAGRKQWLSMD